MALIHKPIISIMMNCFNGEKYLREAIDCVLAQTFQNWELVFWDNQSTDNSAKILKSYNDGRIRYFYAPVHTKLYEARNCALLQCNGKYLTFLDCDDLWSSSKLQTQLIVLEQQLDVVLVHSNTLFFNTYSGKERVLNKTPLKSGYVFRENLFKYRISLETVMVRMDAILSYNLKFGSNYDLIGDRDFLTMVCFFGKAWYIDEVLAKWRVHESNFSKRLFEEHPRELKRMYLRFKERFGNSFTKEMRLRIYSEIVIREALVLFEKSGAETRKKLKRVGFFQKHAFVLRIFTFLPLKLAKKLIQSVSITSI